MSAPWPTLSAPPPEQAPWNWNPAETFLTAYTTVQENQRAQEKAAVDAELSRILLPAKAAEAQYNVKKFQYDAQLLEKLYATKSASLDATYRGINSAVGDGSGTTANEGASEDDFQAIPYQGADAGGATSPAEADQPMSFPQESSRGQMASAEDQEPGYNFSLAGTPFEEGPTNPLYDMPTDNLGERIAMGEASSMGAGSPGGAATVADAASMPVELSLTREDPARGSLGTSPNMLGAENPLERMAEQMPDRVEQPGQTPEEAQPQSSGDPFYDWSTQTLGPWVSKYNERKAALSDSLAKGRIKTPAFRSGREQLKQKADTMVASALLKLDPDQTAQYKTLLQSEVEPIDALLQVSSERPRKRVDGGSAVDMEALNEQASQSTYRLDLLLKSGLDEDSVEVQNERNTLRSLQNKQQGGNDSPMRRVFNTEIGLKNLKIARDSGEIDDATYAEKAGPLQQNLAVSRQEALSSGEDVLNLSEYDQDGQGKFTETGYAALASDLEKKKGEVVGLYGNRNGKSVFVSRRVTDGFIRSAKMGNITGDAPTTVSVAAQGPKFSGGKVAKTYDEYSQEEIDSMTPEQRGRFLREREESRRLQGGLGKVWDVAKAVGKGILEGAGSGR